VTGRYTYMHDFRVPGMLHGRVIRPPGIGAQLLDVDESSVRGLPGFVKTVRQGNFLGVVATDEWSAIRASQKLEAMWSKWEGLPEQAKLFDVFRRSEIARDEVIRQFPRRGRRAVALNVLRGKRKARGEITELFRDQSGPRGSIDK
jgi:nicotinate dehydrogenase subunit B